MPDAHVELLRRRRDRAIATILGVKEREADQFLPDSVSAKLRKTVLDQVNEFYDMCIDLMNANAAHGDVNVHYLERVYAKLDDILERVS